MGVNDLRGKFIKPTLKKSFQIREQVCKTSKEGGRIQLPEPAQNCQEKRVFHGRGRRRSGWRSSRRVCRSCSLDVLLQPALNCTVLYCTISCCSLLPYSVLYCVLQYCTTL